MVTDPRVPLGGVGEDGGAAVPWEPVRPASERAPESDAEAAAQGASARWRFWDGQVRAALRAERRFRREARQAETLYFGEEDDARVLTGKATDSIAQVTDLTGLVHANVEVLKPLLFAQAPTPIVQRRWRGAGKADATDLMAAEAGQRLAQWMVSTMPFEEAMMRVRDDRLIAGRGAARVLYSARFEDRPVIDPATGQPVVGPDGAPMTEEAKAHEEVRVAPVDWPRLLIAPAASWDTVPWIAFEVPITRAQAERRFPDHAARIGYNAKGLSERDGSVNAPKREADGFLSPGESSGQPVDSPFDAATVWEIWDRERRRVIWWSPDYKDDVLDEVDDPLHLEGFFPMPKPLLASTRGGSLNPRPDIAYYEARAREVDEASLKMADLLHVVAVAGLIPASMKDDVEKLLSGKNVIIPVQSWIGLVEKGGTAGIIQWLPLEPIITALNAFSLMREAAKQAMFEASGISDIMRAQGDPGETATAQQIKGRYAGLRVSVLQRSMAVYCRDMLRLMLDVAAGLFDTPRLAAICGLDLPLTEVERQAIHAEALAAQERHAAMMEQHAALQMAAQEAQAAGLQVPAPPPPPPPPPMPDLPETSWEMVHARLRDDLSRSLTVQIETDSTILADEQADKEARIEFLSTFSAMAQQLLPLAGAGLPLRTIKEMLLFAVRGFRNARTLEGMIADLPDEMPQGDAPPDVPVQVAQIKAEADRLIEEMRMADKERDRAHDLRLKGLDLARDTATGAAQGEPMPEPPQPQRSGA